MDPNPHHDRPAADGAVRDLRGGAGQLRGPPRPHGPAESAARAAAADRREAGRGGAELGGGVLPGGAEGSGGAASGPRGPLTIPAVLQEQEERGAGEGPAAGASP